MSKNIYVQISGRLGNQLFSYAFAKKIQMSVAGEIICNFYEVNKTSLLKKDLSFKDELSKFNLDYTNLEEMESFRNLVLNKGSLDQRFLYLIFACVRRIWPMEDYNKKYLAKINRWFARLLSRKGLYVTPFLTGHFEKSSKKSLFIYGKFENAELFEDIEKNLQKSIVAKEVISDKNLNMSYEIQKNESVCISIRRGDFLSKEYMEDFFQCDEKYFKKAINIMNKKLKRPTFFVFSDDIEYASIFANKMLKHNKVFVELEGNTVEEKLMLMRGCKHFIISNSTFSWWAQFLGDFDEKLVIGPKHWFPENGKYQNDKLIQNNWIKI